MAAQNYDQLGREIVNLAGGVRNIVSVTNCATRVRLRLADDEKADLEAIKKLKGVMGALFNIGQLQVIIGPDVGEVVTSVNKAIRELGGTKAGVEGDIDTPEQKDDSRRCGVKGLGRLFIDFLSASIRPVVPAFFAGGMIKVYIVLINLAVPGFSASETATVLGYVANTPFYFLPVLIAYGVSTYYGSNPMYPMVVALGLMYPDFAAAVKNGDTMTLFGVGVPMVDYASKVIPTFLTSVLAHYVAKGMTRVTPKVIKSPIVGPVTLVVTYSAGLLILGPVGTVLTNFLSAVIGWCSDNIGFVTMPVITAALPFLVLTGLGSAFLPLMSQAMEDLGYDGMFRPALTLHNMAEGAAAVGVALKTKDAELRSSCWSLGVGGIVAGVSEPCIFGLDLPYKTPMYAVMAGGAAGAVVASLAGVKAYVMGYSTILALPIYEDTVMGMVAAIAVAIVVSAVTSFILWDDGLMATNGER